MKTDIHTKRLLRFAEHLDGITNHIEHGLPRIVYVHALEERVRISVDVTTQYWVFEELVDCFPEEWSYHPQTGEPHWDVSEPDSNVAECVSDFFGTDNYEHFCHLWDIAGYQQEQFGGVTLTEDSDGPDFAKNIREYIGRTKK